VRAIFEVTLALKKTCPKSRLVNLRKIAERKEISTAGTTLTPVLIGSVRQHHTLDNVMLENGQIHPNMIITVNGQNATPPI
jgi:hypothetical protein